MLNVVLALLGLSPFVLSDEQSHSYADNEAVFLWMDAVGPRDNNLERYNFYSLPHCMKELSSSQVHESIAENLLGHELVSSGLDIRFVQSLKPTTYCEMTLDPQQIATYRSAITQNYMYQMFVDGLPAWAKIGEADGPRLYLFTHVHLKLARNGRSIVSFDAEQKGQLLLPDSGDLLVPLKYQVTWSDSEVEFGDRFDRYLESPDRRIHWFSLVNCLLTLFSLMLIFTVIMFRTFRKDLLRKCAEDDFLDDYGWKLLHADVFRPPKYLTLLSSLLGNGIHIFLTAFFTFSAIFVFELYTGRASNLSAALFFFSVFSFFSGFGGSFWLVRFDGRHLWKRQFILTHLIYLAPLVGSLFLINLVATYMYNSMSIHLTTLMKMSSGYIFLYFPLNLAGTLIGRHTTREAPPLCRVSVCPRVIPSKRSLFKPATLVLFGGVFPFLAILIQMFFVYSSMWAYRPYYLYGFSLCNLVGVVLNSGLTSVLVTYFLLNSEDHRWPWISYLSSFSISLYVWLYSLYFYWVNTVMTGFFQTLFYFVTISLLSLSLGLICGAAGFISSNIFVHHIYSYVKVD